MKTERRQKERWKERNRERKDIVIHEECEKRKEKFGYNSDGTYYLV